MDLNVAWFIIIAFFFIGYFVLEGFDFGVGMLLPVAKTDRKRTAAMKTIGPVWDGNEVWLITGGAAIFAAFPEWYATLFSGFYLPLLLILLALIIRGVSIEWRVKVDTEQWRRRCDTGTFIGSFLPAFLWGVAFTNIVMGVPMNDQGRILNSFWDGFLGLLNPLGLLGGLAFTLAFMLHGATFLGYKTEDPLRSQMHNFAKKWLLIPTTVVGAIYLLWIQLSYGTTWTWIAVAIAALALVAAAVAVYMEHDGVAFALTSIAIIAIGVTLFGSLFPDVLPSTNVNPGWDIYNAASSPYTLKVMTWAAIAFVPLVLIAQGWTYWSFRKRVRV